MRGGYLLWCTDILLLAWAQGKVIRKDLAGESSSPPPPLFSFQNDRLAN